MIAGFVVYVATGTLESDPRDLFGSALLIAFTAVGALVALRHPRNAIGWIFLGVAMSIGVSVLAHAFVDYRLQDGADQNVLVGAAAAYADASWIPFVLIPATLLLLLFPDGKLPTRRWRIVAWCASAGIAGTLFTNGARPEPLGDFPTVRNPLAIDSPVMEPLLALSGLLVIVGMLGSVASVVVRFRRAGRLQRQQIKWLATAGAVVAVTIVTMFALYDVVGQGVADSAMMFTVLGLPVAAGIAILRHNLYDIDVVINRTLVYGALTATLAGTYLGSVLLLQLVLSGVTANSGLAVAGSTLAVAALFRPARGRIQATVDRRFYRRKYDAVRTLQQFGAHLRDEVDLDALGGELRGVVADTMQPAHVSLWLRDGPARDSVTLSGRSTHRKALT
ncbi:MAG: hypothetical protein H0X56_02160 [Solirubrobacterales bacterium]|nr:hypothetical protein [Solirubrobacterales bacterium]